MENTKLRNFPSKCPRRQRVSFHITVYKENTDSASLENQRFSANIMGKASREVCRFYSAGKCRFGRNCRNLHSGGNAHQSRQSLVHASTPRIQAVRSPSVSERVEKALKRLHNNGERALNMMTKGGKKPFCLTVWGARKGDDISEWQWKRMEEVNV